MMRLQLDTPAVRRLLEDNPEMKLELTRACVAEVVKQTVAKDMGTVMKAIEPAVYAQLVERRQELGWLREKMDNALREMMQPEYCGVPLRLKPNIAAKLEEAIAGEQSAIVARAASGLIRAVQEAVEARAAEIESVVERLVAHIQEKMIAAEVDRRLQAKMRAIYENVK